MGRRPARRRLLGQEKPMITMLALRAAHLTFVTELHGESRADATE
jgi:hypothetical protein